jgi:hypothetical protein
MAELLVRAKKHWMDDLTQKQVDAMTPEEKRSYSARSQIGDVIVVRGDGWKWGKCECPPEYVVVKVPGMSESDAKHYEESLYEDVEDKDGKVEKKLLRIRKHSLPKTDIETAKTEEKQIELTSTSLSSKTTVKSGLASECIAPIADEVM